VRRSVFVRFYSSGELPPGAAAPIGPGRVVLIVGPSGAGKDAVLGEVRGRFAGDRRFVFPRRVVTRNATSAEDHDPIARAAFEAQRRRGTFALHWQAHGLQYGIPADIDDAVRTGMNVVFNASRRVTSTARARYVNAAVVLIDAPLEVRIERLVARNRERAKDIAARLERVVPDFNAVDADLVIQNVATLARAADLLCEWLHTAGSSR
jgi:ribose 1,5-bisphosphokinase